MCHSKLHWTQDTLCEQKRIYWTEITDDLSWGQDDKFIPVNIGKDSRLECTSYITQNGHGRKRYLNHHWNKGCYKKHQDYEEGHQESQMVNRSDWKRREQCRSQLCLIWVPLKGFLFFAFGWHHLSWFTSEMVGMLTKLWADYVPPNPKHSQMSKWGIWVGLHTVAIAMGSTGSFYRWMPILSGPERSSQQYGIWPITCHCHP